MFYLINWIFAAESIQGRKLYREIRYLIFTCCLYQLTLILYKMNRKWSLIICLHCGLDLIGLDQQDCRGATQFMKSTRNIRRRRRWMSSGLWNGVTWISDGNEWNLQQCNGAKAIFLYYEKSWDGKRYPFVNVKTVCHLDGANSIKTALRTCNLLT